MYGAGEENIGKDGKPEQLPIPQPAANQMLVRVDSVGLCFSDVKLIKMGGSHPKLYNRDLTKEPTRLGHEASSHRYLRGRRAAGIIHPGPARLRYNLIFIRTVKAPHTVIPFPAALSSIT